VEAILGFLRELDPFLRRYRGCMRILVIERLEAQGKYILASTLILRFQRISMVLL
jgi:hypothetical protein